MNVADLDPTTSRTNLQQLRSVRNDYPAGDFEILAFPCDQFGYRLSPNARQTFPGALYDEFTKDGKGMLAPVGPNLPYRLFEGKDNLCMG